jgi:signal transduction histidine kinase
MLASQPMQQHRPVPEREQTDESLRAEREQTDEALDDDRAVVEDAADAVIARARMRADQLLAAARAKTDRHAANVGHGIEPSSVLQRERVREDQVLRDERASADATLKVERAEHVALLSRQRDETDKDLSHERDRSDASLATRDDFLGIVSHDLRNMLNAIVGAAAVMGQRSAAPDPDGTIRLYAQRIQRFGGRMDRLIGDLVDVASIEAGMLAVTPEVADPTQVVAEAVDAFALQAATGGIVLETEIIPPASQAVFDPARILQVITNVLSNALKFTPRGGRVIVRVERIGEEIAFAVSDTGIGIPADSLQAVFVRFRQVRKNDRRGMGLGLYISQSIVQGHGGRIWVESLAPLPGCKVCFTLPIAGR